MSSAAWTPLESNPEVMNEFLSKIGIPSKWQLNDVLGLDDELLAMVPQPALALILGFPCTAKAESELKELQEAHGKGDSPIDSKIYFMKQTIGNACGTIALIHAIGNLQDTLKLESGYVKEFLDLTKDMDAAERGSRLEQYQAIIQAHAETAAGGQTQAPNPGDKVNHHYVALVRIGDTLYELDGRKPLPVSHGSSTSETFLKDAGAVCKKFMARDPNEVSFTILAFSDVSA